jgi:hypothetical protein
VKNGPCDAQRQWLDSICKRHWADMCVALWRSALICAMAASIGCAHGNTRRDDDALRVAEAVARLCECGFDELAPGSREVEILYRVARECPMALLPYLGDERLTCRNSASRSIKAITIPCPVWALVDDVLNRVYQGPGIHSTKGEAEAFWRGFLAESHS